MPLRHAIRSLRRTPWYSITVIATIALSMALATTVFALADGVLFKALPYKDAHELHVLGAPFSQLASVVQIREWAAAIPEIPLSAYRRAQSLGATADDSPTRLWAVRVGPKFFGVLGQHAAFGGFQPEHFAPTEGPVPALLSHGMWQRLFGGSMSAIGQPFDLVGAVQSGRALTFVVAGVLPRDFMFPDAGESPDLVLPLALTPGQEADRNESAATALIRIPPGTTPESIKARVDAVAATQGFRDANADVRTPAMGPADPRVSLNDVAGIKNAFGRADYRNAFAAAAVLVGLSCVNVVALGLARSRQRRRDLGIRRALGATRWQLVRQTLAETAPLVGVGTAAGLIVAPWLVRLVMSLMDARVPVLTMPEIGWRVIAFAATTGLAFVIAVVAMQQRSVGAAHHVSLIGRGAGVTDRRGWWSPSLLSVQIALAMILTVGGTLLVGSLWWAWQQDPGFTPGEAVIVDLNMGGGPVADRTARFNAVLDRVRAEPGVREIGIVSGPILRRSWMIPAIERPAGVSANDEQAVGAGGDFFSILGIRAIAGRLFTPDEERSNAPVAVVSERIARKYWPGQSAVGQSLQSRGRDPHAITIVGVVRDARFAGPDDGSRGQIYSPQSGLVGSLLVRGDGSAEETLQSTLRAIRGVGPPVGVTHANTVAGDLGEPMRRRTFAAWLYGAFAASSLFVVAVGLIGFVAMSTETRTREIGIRGALGAGRSRIIAMILREQAVAVIAGLVVGGAIASWSASYLKRSMFGFDVHDERLWAIATATIILVALAGTLIPAWRAVRVNAVEALRAD